MLVIGARQHQITNLFNVHFRKIADHLNLGTLAVQKVDPGANCIEKPTIFIVSELLSIDQVSNFPSERIERGDHRKEYTSDFRLHQFTRKSGSRHITTMPELA